MLRTCVHCGVERETPSARTRYVCNASPCQNKARRTNRPSRHRAREALYFKRVKKGIREGKGPAAYVS